MGRAQSRGMANTIVLILAAAVTCDAQCGIDEPSPTARTYISRPGQVKNVLGRRSTYNMRTLLLIQALCALLTVATSQEVISPPEHFFPYGLDAEDTKLDQTARFSERRPFSSPFISQGSSFEAYAVSVFIIVCFCIERVEACFKCII